LCSLRRVGEGGFFMRAWDRPSPDGPVVSASCIAEIDLAYWNDVSNIPDTDSEMVDMSGAAGK
jgi:hypothetical protein